MRTETLTIGKVARQTGIGIETIRFYEREGLIPKPPRRPSGYRLFPADIIDRIRFIKRAKELGFTLAEIKELLFLKVGRGTNCGDVKRRTDQKIAEVEQKIADLRRIRLALEKLAARCRGRGPVSACPILENLGRHNRRGVVENEKIGGPRKTRA